MTEMVRRRARWAEAARLANPQSFTGGPVTVPAEPEPAKPDIYIVQRCPACGQGFSSVQGMKIHYGRTHR